MLIQWPGIGGWQWRSLYETWQNSCVAGSYERKFGVMPSGIRRFIQSDGGGIGSGRDMIDISANSGRRKALLSASNFHPSAEMWLGPDFWQFAKCSKKEVLAADFFIEIRDTPHFLYLKSWPQPFTRPDGEQGRTQQKLWRLLFHEDCEWPPGSGLISDEAVYGPPELMPPEGAT
ncbi:hypothetical protein OKA05_08300 [Luteolibacter arcticus]|uniref:Uncharacterized protein n=1 Tax=Luteolibacter arcticus TaxID=1581411 RepID=A0ABT3GG06_9BACT|nr:hypothetical protein [Luteolibacter arcticus]MCW1922553.1 hypothetical protein [Luteolibacter arcticus]